MSKLRSSICIASLCTLLAPAAWASDYACSNHEFSSTLPSIEGKDGFFFRTFADLRMQHPMTSQVIEQLGRLSDALEEGGTTLVYVTIPSKSQAMPDYLPPRSAEYSFDVEAATAVYQDITERLSARGLLAPDIQTALRGASAERPPFFRADFHWTSEGARLAGEAIGNAIKSHPAYADVTPSTFTSRETGPQAAFSGMRRALQSFCKDELPRVETMAYATEKTNTADGNAEDGGGGLDIFASGGDDAIQAVLVGTSFSDSAINNFAGFVSEYSGLEVLNYAITGGNQFGAITSYLTSDEFLNQRPRFLIWENPIYNNLAQYGPNPMEELITAVGNTCTIPLEVSAVDETTVLADLSQTDIKPGDVLFANAGGQGIRRADFAFTTKDDIKREATIARGDRLTATGRFYQSFDLLWAGDLAQVQVKFDRPVNESASLTICRTIKEDAS